MRLAGQQAGPHPEPVEGWQRALGRFKMDSRFRGNDAGGVARPFSNHDVIPAKAGIHLAAFKPAVHIRPNPPETRPRKSGPAGWLGVAKLFRLLYRAGQTNTFRSDAGGRFDAAVGR
jgi:hypothetical protein